MKVIPIRDLITDPRMDISRSVQKLLLERLPELEEKQQTTGLDAKETEELQELQEVLDAVKNTTMG